MSVSLSKEIFQKLDEADGGYLSHPRDSLRVFLDTKQGRSQLAEHYWGCTALRVFGRRFMHSQM